MIRRTLTQDRPNGDRIVARIEIREPADAGTLSPAVSLTGEVYESRSNAKGATRQRQGLDPDTSGAISDVIVKAWPQLAPVAAAHLSDPITGEPMHAEANGWYWYAGTRADLRETNRYTGHDSAYAWQLAERGLGDSVDGRATYCYQLACETLRVAQIPADLDREAFAAFVDGLRAQWRDEVAAVRQIVEALPND